jgi:hypothetical protein
MDDLTRGTIIAAEPFNSAVEVGLRALAVLVASHPVAYGLQRLTVLDYLVVHSDDIPEGPPGLHPQTPYRAGELLLRRGVLEEGLLLYQSRGLVERRFEPAGVYYEATDTAAAFLDALTGSYLETLRDRAAWVTEHFASTADEGLFDLVDGWIGEWGAEFTQRSILREELA